MLNGQGTGEWCIAKYERDSRLFLLSVLDITQLISNTTIQVYRGANRTKIGSYGGEFYVVLVVYVNM